MKRSKPLQRTTRLRASGPIRPTRKTKAERDAKFLREYGGPDRHAFVESLSCLVPGCPRKAVNAHVVNIDAGMSRKGHYTGIAPLCDLHHTDSKHALHEVGPQTFQRLHHLDLAQCAAHTERQWQKRQSAPVPLSRIVPGVVRAIVEGGEC